MSEYVAVWDGTRWVSIRGEKGDAGKALAIKGVKPTVTDLPTPGVEGDLWIVAATGDGYTWDAAAVPPAYINIGRLQGPAGPAGAKGDKGADGAAGPAGASATVAVGTVSTGAAGSSAKVTNTGTTSAAVLNFTIPAGDKGDAGPTGPAPTLSVVSTTDTANGNPAAVSIAATGAGAYGLSFVIPQGARGPAGSSITYKGTASTWPPATPAAGDAWQIGSPAPAGAPAPAGHMVTYDGTTWHDNGQIKGEKGDAGPTQVSVDAGNVAKLGADGLLYVAAGSTPIATTTTLGGIIVGKNLTIDAAGKLDATAAAVPVATTTATGTVTLADANAITTKDGTKVVTAAQLMGQVELRALADNPALTGVVTIDAGTAAAPSLSFKGDADTGVFSPAQDRLSLAVAGKSVLDMTAGRVTFPAGVTIGGKDYPTAAGTAGQVLAVGTGTALEWAHALTDSSGVVFAKPGDDLAAKYAAAKALRPNGAALSSTNRAALVIAPGAYTLAAKLAIDTNFVDVVGLGSAPHAPAVTIGGNTVNVTATNVNVVGVSVGSQSFQVLGPATVTPTQRITNCVGGDDSFGGPGAPSGTYAGCVGGVLSFVGSTSASGTFTNCIGGAGAFGSGATLTGKLYGCRLTSGKFPTVTGTGLTRDCINADGTYDNQGGYYGTDVSTPPTNGQAWVWDATLAKWKPGTIASGFTCADGTTQKSLDDVADLLRVFAGCAAAQPVKPDGTKATGWEAVALKSSEFVKTLPDGTVVAFDPDALVMVYDTTNDTTGDLTVVVPINQVAVVPNVTIDWGDGTAKQAVTAKANVTHTYAKAGRYVVQVKGTMDWFGFSATDARNVKLTQCLSWGKAQLASLEGAFRSASKMNAPVPPIPATVKSTNNMFASCVAFNQPILAANATAIVDMGYMFADCHVFNQSVSTINTSAATNLSGMFASCYVFNQSVSLFNTAAATSMSSMFSNCRAFNQPVNNFNTAKVTNMKLMFAGCQVFNQPVGNFNTAAVENMQQMFGACTAFNQSVSNFNTAAVKDMGFMFSGCNAFNQAVDGFAFSAINIATGLDGFKSGTANFTTAHYDALLLKWKATLDGFGGTVPTAWKTLKPTVQNVKYTKAPSAAAAAHAALTAIGWTITDGGPTP